jgi:hypothetical protein
MPADVIPPSASSLATCCRFLANQFEPGFLGVSRWRNDIRSSARHCPSIQPKRIALTTQSAHVTD